MKEGALHFLINLVPKCETNTTTRNKIIPTFNCQINCFKYFFFPSTLNDWFKLDLNIISSDSISIFKSRLLSLIHPIQTNIYNIFDPKALTFLTRLRLQPWPKYFRQTVVFLCEIAPYGRSSISIFQEFFARIDKILILGAGLDTRL